MVPWGLAFALASAVVIVLGIKIVLLYRGLREISEEFEGLLMQDTNNVLYVSGRDRYLRDFANRMNKELGILYDRRRKYQNGDRELKEAVTNISHDLRTPLTAIYGYLELLEAEQKSEAVEHYLAQVRNRADALKALTEELFRYSVIAPSDGKSEAGSKKQKIILNRILADCLISYYDIFKKNGMDVEAIIPDEEVVRLLDSGALKRVFGNILDNAIKYSSLTSDETGIVSDHISENGTIQKKMRVELSCDGTVTFRNSAKHLDKVSTERLFDRFFTVETGRNSTGLGLSIARLLVERMGGNISAEYKDRELIIKIRFEQRSG